MLLSLRRTSYFERSESLSYAVTSREQTPWEMARIVTDNRLRAMRFWFEGWNGFSSLNIASVQRDLEKCLGELADTAKRLRKSEDESKIRELLQLAQNIKGHERTFDVIYEFIGMSVPETVHGEMPPLGIRKQVFSRH